MEDFPEEMLKVTPDKHLSLTTRTINLSFENGCFLDNLKLAEVSPIFKKNDDLDKENHTTVSVLFNVSKVFERIVYNKNYLYHLQESLVKSHKSLYQDSLVEISDGVLLL